MFARGFRRFVCYRAFSKDMRKMQQEFERMTKLNQASASTEANPDEPNQTLTEEEEIKLTDQNARKEQLQDQFKGLHDDLKGRTGQAKSFAERMAETMYSAKSTISNIPGFAQRKQEEARSQDESEPAEATTTKETSTDESTTKAAEEPGAEGETENAEATPEGEERVEEVEERTGVFRYTKIAGDYIVDAIRETFPSPEYKKEQYMKNKDKIKEAARKMQGLDDDENISQEHVPEWKRYAVLEVEEQLTSWQKLKKRVSESTYGAKLNQARKDAGQSEAMKELKDSTAQLKEGIRDIIDDSENPIVQRAREEAAKLRWETEQAKAIRVVRLIDPNFDIYETENELEQIIRDVYESHLSEDLDYVQSVTFGQAQSYFDGQVKEWEKTKMKPARREIIQMTKPIFMGVNNEEKHMPRFNYNTTLWLSQEKKWTGPKNPDEFENDEERMKYVNFRVLNGYVSEESDDEFGLVRHKSKARPEKVSFHVTICKHPDPNLEVTGHTWQIVTFQPLHEQKRLE